MKYVSPPGEGADASYQDGNAGAGFRGSIVPGAAVEHVQREVVEVITYFGLTPDEADLTQLRKAIQAGIAAATGGGSTGDYLTVAIARARLPIFPEVLTADGRINVGSPGAGTIVVPAGAAFQHRGIFPVSTSDYSEPSRTFATAVNKTYHLRWTPTGGFVLKDVADATYNPGAAAESSAVFDTTYDDMLVARIVTNPSNVAAVTNLANKNSLLTDFTQQGPSVNFPAQDYIQPWSLAVNWSRTPFANVSFQAVYDNQNSSSFDRDWNVTTEIKTRYVASGRIIANNVSSAPIIGGLLIAR